MGNGKSGSLIESMVEHAPGPYECIFCSPHFCSVFFMIHPDFGWRLRKRSKKA